MTEVSFPAPPWRAGTAEGGLAIQLLKLPLSPRLAVAMALALWACVTLGDYLTMAEAVFTIFYLIPIGIATWFRGERFGVATAVLCTVGSVATDVHGHSHSSVLFLLWDDGGEFLVFLGFVWLLGTLRRHLEREQQLRQASIDQLRHAERLNTLGKLASGVAHELGTPLNVILGQAELVQNGRADAAASAQIIQQQAERMTLIIRQLLDFSRRSGTRKAKASLKQLCEETRALLLPIAHRAGADIQIHGQDIEVDLNRGELQQVLSNLITNSVHAMPKGGNVEIGISKEHISRHFPDSPAVGDYALLTVRDEGTGIPLAILPKIFDPFFTTKDVGEGTGLGLSVSHGIVRDHGGWVRVKSSVGEGTTFFVYLPLSRAA